MGAGYRRWSMTICSHGRWRRAAPSSAEHSGWWRRGRLSGGQVLGLGSNIDLYVFEMASPVCIVALVSAFDLLWTPTDFPCSDMSPPSPFSISWTSCSPLLGLPLRYYRLSLDTISSPFRRVRSTEVHKDVTFETDDKAIAESRFTCSDIHAHWHQSSWRQKIFRMTR